MRNILLGILEGLGISIVVSLVLVSLFAFGFNVGYRNGTHDYFWKPSNLKASIPINVLVGFADGDYKKDYIDKNTPTNLHDWLVKTALENATSANLTWNYTPFKEYGTLTVNWEK